jgi:hypothetical protein
VTAITIAAAQHGAVACPVLTRTGAVDEVHLFRNGGAQASIFMPMTGRVGIWRADGDPATANTPEEAVRRALDPLRKHTRKPCEIMEYQRLRRSPNRATGRPARAPVPDIGVLRGAPKHTRKRRIASRS